MSNQEREIAIHAILLKIHVITGWIVPSDDKLLDILLEQFEKKIIESYENVNADEVEYAFRTYGYAVKEWGKAMNLSLIVEVMTPYLETRREVSKIEEQKKEKLLDAPKEDTGEKAMQDWYNSTAKDFKEGKIKLEFLPPMLSDWLTSKGEIDPQQYFKRAAIEIGKKLREESDLEPKSRPKYLEFKSMYEQATKEGKPFTGNWALQIENLAKKIALNNYILQEQEL